MRAGDHNLPSGRLWLARLAITLTALICLFAFDHLAPKVTFVIAVLALIGLMIAFWQAGKNP